MHRRALLAVLALAGPCLLGAPAARAFTPTAQDQADLRRIQAYLDGMHSLKARFLQIAPDGSTSGGTAWLERPGRMRFQYDPPSPLLLVAGHGLVVFHDAELEQTSNIPLGSTPLGILLADHITLSGPVTVTGIERQPGEIQLTLERTASPADGSLTLVFADPPLQLRSWTVVDAQRKETRVSLFNVELGGSFPDKLFEFIDPRFFQQTGPKGGGG
ncbi:MAG: outer membrane lipoprotein carrier protein LolA [Acidisphaera sp.]|nr:outer membrane lipoprotein carrier protein LolA [Acidisphaera sp.]